MRNPKYIVCVDNRPECLAGLKLACAKARRREGNVVLLHVMEPVDFQSIKDISDRMESEQREAAESLLARLAAESVAPFGLVPTFMLRTGHIGEEIVAAISEDIDASVLVLGVAETASTRGRLVSWLAAQLGVKLAIPLLLVPGNLTDQQLEALI